MLAISLTALLSFSALQAQQPAPQAATVAQGQTAEIRPFYDRKTPVMVKLPADTPLEVLHQNVPWSRVKVPGGLVVWVHQDFVELDGSVAVVKTSRLRARPLPSTSGLSHPIGKLQQGDRLQVLDQEEEWLKVLAPETLGAWVQSRELTLLASAPADWKSRWDKAAAKRRNEILAGAKPIVVGADDPAAETEKVEDEPKTGDLETPSVSTDSPPSGVGEKVIPTPVAKANSPREPKAAFRSKVLEKLITPDVLSKNPTQALAKARENLDLHATEVTDAINYFAAPVLENCEMVFTDILLHKSDVDSLISARKGLTRADALRQFHKSAQDARTRKQDLKSELTSQNASASGQKKKDAMVVPEGGTGSYAWVGYVKYRPHQYPKTPFVAVRGKREVLLHSFDGRFYLKDFQGREIAVRGTWRETPDDSKLKVLAVEELRVLPRAAKLK